MWSKKVKVVLSLIGIFLLGVLTGCTNYNMDHVESTAYSVIEVERGFSTDDSVFAYYDENGNQKVFSDCGQENIFTSHYCRTDDGSITFNYGLYKGMLVGTSITVNDVTYDLSCGNSDNDAFNGSRVCVPNE